ncbi:MAG: lipopolysaccharide biosynthesis protein [Candidatus Pelagadaptatus aseana]|uniref:flippase n=1 Tax=Candidatus Pelagadaptatus aseana TaxID=3120508 RepID=UPI0039B218CA
MSFLNSDFFLNLFKTGVTSLVVRLIGVILSLIVSIVLARFLGVDQYGEFSFVLSTLLLISVPVQMGFPQLLIRETAKVDVSGKWEEVYSIWVWSTVCVLTASFAVVVSIYTLAYFDAIIPDSLRPLFLVGVFIVPVLSLARLCDSAIRGLHYILRGQLIDSIVKPTALLIGIFLCFYFDFGMTSLVAIYVYVGAVFVTVLSGSIVLRYLMPHELLVPIKIRFETSKWIAAVVPLGFFSSLHIINSQVDLIMLGLLDSMEGVGVYKVAMSLAAIIGFGLQVVNTVIGPQFSKLHANGDAKRLERLFMLSIKITVCMAIPAVLVHVFFGDHILQILFGDRFVVGYFTLVILVVGQLLNSIIGSVGLLLNMTGHVRETLLAGVCGLLVNVILNISLIPIWGMEGAAFSSLISLMVCNILLSYFVRRQLGVSNPFMKLFNL